jgi:membrane protease YdiL (CAAX protease family)
MELKRRIDLELLLVFGLSLGKSAVYSILALIAALTAEQGLGGTSTTINRSEAAQQWLDFFYQFVGNIFPLVPVALVLFLLGAGALKRIGVTREKLGQQLWIGFGLAAAIGIPGLGLYLGARAIGAATKVVATDVIEYWWTLPMLLLSAIGASLLEEVIMIGYLFNRLRERGMNEHKIIWLSAVIRGTYHLYQGFGGFVGNMIMGLLFGYIYKRTGKLVPLLFAHFILDAAIVVGYAWASTWLPLN